jgi:hypothetical protein
MTVWPNSTGLPMNRVTTRANGLRLTVTVWSRMGRKLAAVKAAAQVAGVARPFFASVPEDDLAVGGG